VLLARTAYGCSTIDDQNGGPRPAPAARRPAMTHCRFRTSYGGARFCQDPAYLEGFCKFHHDALCRGEINEHGVINELVSDQARRHAINYHGIPLDEATYLEDLR
jgi:hypothetical protein